MGKGEGIGRRKKSRNENNVEETRKRKVKKKMKEWGPGKVESKEGKEVERKEEENREKGGKGRALTVSLGIWKGGWKRRKEVRKNEGNRKEKK